MPRLIAALLCVGLIAIGLMAGSSTATFSGKNGRIIFTRAVGNGNEIFSANPDGSHKKQLTVSKPRGSVSFESDWSPDGETIAFDSDRTDVDGRKQPVQIYTMDADGGNLTQLTRGGGFHATPGWSPSGTSIAITAEWEGKPSSRGIWIIPASDADGVTVDEALRVTNVPKRAEFDDEPQFSPDGQTIFFTRFKSFERSAIFRVNVDGTGKKRLTNYNLNASHPDVSPDGRWITFDSGDSGAPGVTGDVYLLRSDGSGKKKKLTDNVPQEADAPLDLAQNPSFSPNGRRIIYTQFQPPGTDLIVMKTNGSGKHAILGGRRFPNKADWGTHP